MRFKLTLRFVRDDFINEDLIYLPAKFFLSRFVYFCFIKSI